MHNSLVQTVSGILRDRRCHQTVDLSNIPTRDFATRIGQRLTALGYSVKPEVEALRYYLLEEALGVIRRTCGDQNRLSLDDAQLVQLYADSVAEQSVRAAYYLFLICTREARHLPDWDACAKHPLVLHEFETFLPQVKDQSDAASVIKAINKGIDASRTLSPYVRALGVVFWHGGWGGSYGGPKWGAITEVLKEFVEGRMTPSLLVDAVWALQHNCCAIFNKGMLYESMHTERLNFVLGLQRAGMLLSVVKDTKVLPSHIRDDYWNTLSNHPRVAPVLRLMRKSQTILAHQAAAFSWAKVEELSNLQPMSPEMPNWVKKPAAKKKPPPMAHVTTTAVGPAMASALKSLQVGVSVSKGENR